MTIGSASQALDILEQILCKFSESAADLPENDISMGMVCGATQSLALIQIVRKLTTIERELVRLVEK